MTGAMAVLAVGVLYMAVGRGMLAAWGAIGGKPIGLEAMLAAARGAGVESPVTADRQEVAVLVRALWVLMLVLWPAALFLLATGHLMGLMRRSCSIGGKDWSLSIGGHQED